MATEPPDSISSVPKERASCTVHALAAALGLPWEQAHALLAEHGRKRSRRFNLKKKAAGIFAGSGTEARQVRRSGTLERLQRDFPTGRLLVGVRGHALAIVNGEIKDNRQTPLRSIVRGAWLIG